MVSTGPAARTPAEPPKAVNAHQRARRWSLGEQSSGAGPAISDLPTERGPGGRLDGDADRAGGQDADPGRAGGQARPGRQGAARMGKRASVDDTDLRRGPRTRCA